MRDISHEKYKEITLSVIPRLLSNIDRDPLSSTYGCADKAYWWYKTKDFPCSRLQESGHFCALLYKENFSGNIFVGSKEMRDTAFAVLAYTTKIQHKNGSFDEWYPSEESFCATAFVTYAIAQMYLLLKEDLPQKIREDTVSCLRKAGLWLAHRDMNIGNQLAGALAALACVYRVTGDSSMEISCRTKIQALLRLQSTEGWFAEYGGADPGYQTVSLEFLARYYRENKDSAVLPIAQKAISFLLRCIYPNGTLGGAVGSRGTSFIFMYGIEYFASLFPESAAIKHHLASKQLQKVSTPDKMDDRYGLIYCCSYLEALLHHNTPKKAALWWYGKAHFPEAGLFISSEKNKYFIINGRKGGTFQLFTRSSEVKDNGLFIRINGQLATNQWMDATSMSVEKDSIRVTGRFVKVPMEKTLTSLKLIGLRIILMAFPAKKFLSDRIKEYLITKREETAVYVERIISLKEKEIVVEDKIFPNGHSIEFLSGTKETQAQYVPTARFYSSLCNEPNIKPNTIAWQKSDRCYVATRIIVL